MRRDLGLDETQAEAGNGEPDPMQVQQGSCRCSRSVLGMEATSMGARAPTTQ